MAVVAVGGSFALKGLSSLGGGSGDTPKELLFVSDGSVFGVNLKKPDEKPVEYTDSFYESDEDDMGDVFRISFPTVSGKYRFIRKTITLGMGLIPFVIRPERKSWKRSPPASRATM